MNPNSRHIAIALALAVLLFGWSVWGPDVRLPSHDSALTVTATRTEQQPLPAVVPTTPQEQPETASSPTATDTKKPVKRKEAQSKTPPPVVAQLAPQTAPIEAAVVPPQPDKAARTPLPREAQLTFAINLGQNGIKIGEAVHTLAIEQGRYTLQSFTRTVGLASLFKDYQLTQHSEGIYHPYGLVPESFYEERKDKVSVVRTTAKFNHATGNVQYSNGNERALPPSTQDILSIMYQLPLDGSKLITISVCSSTYMDLFKFEVDYDEEITTSLGKLHTIHLHKLPPPNQEGLDLWLSKEHHLLPVKIRYFEPDGKIGAEAMITDLRVSPENGIPHAAD